MTKPILLGLTGPTGVGKDTVAQILIEQHGFVRLAFGDALKKCVQIAFGLEDKWLTDEYKTTLHPYWARTPREMFQLTGTEAFRSVFGSDFWVRRLSLEYAALKDQRVVVTDVRHVGAETEPEWVRANGGAMVHILGPQRRGDVNAAHVSNTPVTYLEGDRVLTNEHDIVTLRQHVGLLLENLL